LRPSIAFSIFFLLEKAFYEIEYELAHRPDWLRVPLAGTWRILSRSQGTPQWAR
jgi:maltose alpha-D-glucosyltransferase / alpha-amylase